MHEASLHDQNSFVTLTYADEALPPWSSLRKKDFQDFMKRLRRRVDVRIRFFHCGEYGDKFLRPHYHALLFGLGFPDAFRIEDSYGGHPQWMSPLLSKVWPAGRATVGEVNFESAAYVARYCIKKVNGKAAESHYLRVDKTTGETAQVQPEYATMSRRPGIGRDWIAKYSSDVYPSDELIVRGHASKPPRYYDDFYKAGHDASFADVKHARARARSREDESPARLSVREVCATARAKLFSRRLEE